MMSWNPIVFVTMVLSFVDGLGQQYHLPRQLSEEYILDYEPSTIVTDEAALDLDVLSMRSYLGLHTAAGFDTAAALYRKGAFSLSYAQLDLDEPLEHFFAAGTRTSGETKDSDPVVGFLHRHGEKGSSTIKVAYKTTGVQKSYVDCQVGANPTPKLDGCLVTSGEIQIGNEIPRRYSYDPKKDNKNERTIRSLSHNLEKKMGLCDHGCPKDDFKKFLDYYGTGDYSDQWIAAIFNQKPTELANGNADFKDINYPARMQAILIASVDMSVWMKVIERMELALDSCNNNCDDDCFLDRVAPWDQAVAFYVGSIAKTKFGLSGEFPYSNAEKSCVKFGTCGSTKSVSTVNQHVMKLFQQGKDQILNRKCDATRDTKQRIVKLMQIPLIQNTLHSAFELGEMKTNSEWTRVVAATSAATVLPIVHNCSAADAKIIYDNLKLGHKSTNFAAVKEAFERNYECMGAYCNEIGAVLNDDGTSRAGAEACVHIEGSTILASTSDYSDDNKAMKLGLGVGLPFALLLAFAACFSVCVHDLNKGKEYDGMEGEPEAPKEASEPKEATDEESAPAELT